MALKVNQLSGNNSGISFSSFSLIIITYGIQGITHSIRHYATIIGYRGIELIESWVIEV